MAVTDHSSPFPLSVGQRLPVQIPILDRYVLGELIAPFLFGPRYRDWETDRKSTRLNSSHSAKSRMPSSA